MDELSKLSDFLYSWLLAIINYLLLIPNDILAIGCVLGFLCASAGRQNSRFHATGIFYSLCNASSLLAAIMCFFMAGYILWNFSAVNLFYYACAVIAGVVLGRVIQVLLNKLTFLGDIINLILVTASGPLALICSWFFHEGILVRQLFFFKAH